MRLIVDARERSLIQLLGDVEVKTLDVGDVLCEDASWIMEQRTADNLARSIMDGRWQEQKHRLMQNIPF